MTIKDLQRLMTEKQGSSELTRLIERLYSKPFWIWDVNEHKSEDIRTNGRCCFNHVIGLPKKDGVEKPMFDYEKMLYDFLLLLNENDFKDKHLWVKKATGLGVTEFFLRLIVWLCLKDESLSGSQVCIITGPNLQLAIGLIRRLKALFEPHNIYFDSKETVTELNGVRIEAFPSNHLDAMRSLDKVSFVLMDEADFFSPREQQNARNVSERYIGKSNPFLVMVSTPNAPGQLFEQLEKESEDGCIYKRIKLDYTYGLDRIYTREEIDKAKTSSSFEREYNLKYLGMIGNTFSTNDIDKAISIKYNPDYINKFAACSMGLDPAWGSSNFGMVITQLGDSTEEDPGGAEGSIQVLYAEEFEKPEHSEILDTVVDLIHSYNVTKVYIDGANPSFIRSLKIQLGENPEYERVIERAHHDKFDFGEIMRVIPINFSTDHKKMLGHTKTLVEKGLIAIHPTRFDKLLTSLRTATDNEGKLQKESTSYDDIFDAFRLSLKMYYLK